VAFGLESVRAWLRAIPPPAPILPADEWSAPHLPAPRRWSQDNRPRAVLRSVVFHPIESFRISLLPAWRVDCTLLRRDCVPCRAAV